MTTRNARPHSSSTVRYAEFAPHYTVCAHMCTSRTVQYRAPTQMRIRCESAYVRVSACISFFIAFLTSK